MKGQTQALTAVLITFITVGAISAAYIWGTPLLEKRESQAQVQTVEQDIFSLYDSIISTSNGGTDTSDRIDLNMPEGTLTVNEEKDYIEIEITAQDPPYPRDTWTLLEGETLQNTTIVGAGNYGIKSQDSPGIIAVNTQPGLAKYRIDFRNLKTSQPSHIERVDLQTSGSSQASGDTELLVTNNGVETDSNVNIGSENLDTERTIIEISIQ